MNYETVIGPNHELDDKYKQIDEEIARWIAQSIKIVINDKSKQPYEKDIDLSTARQVVGLTNLLFDEFSKKTSESRNTIFQIDMETVRSIASQHEELTENNATADTSLVVDVTMKYVSYLTSDNDLE